jgi:hypothetical protein
MAELDGALKIGILGKYMQENSLTQENMILKHGCGRRGSGRALPGQAQGRRHAQAA